MSFDAMTWAIRQQLEPVPRLVLLALADRADKQGRAWPSVGWLAEFCGFHRSTIMRELARLQRLNLIENTGLRKGLTHQVKVWQLRQAEDGLPFARPRGGKGRSIGDTLQGMKVLLNGETVSLTGKGRPSETVSETAKGRSGGTGRSRRPVAPNAGKGRSGATRNQLEPVTERETRKSPQRIFEIAADWQPPTLPLGSRLRSLVEHWSPDELGERVDDFRARASTDGVTPDLAVAWQAYVWLVEMEDGASVQAKGEQQ
jgi:hypothetical protein